jgi:acyl dehydratase
MDLTPGAELPEFVRKTGFAHWNRYAAVNDEFISIHMDDEAGKAAGFPSAIGMGNLAWSYAHIMLRRWMGPNGKIEKLAVQYQLPNLRESTITVHGKVVEVAKCAEGSRALIDLWADDDADRKLISGQATMLIRSA